MPHVSFSPAMVRAFADASGDRNRLHWDAAYARATPYGRPIVQGVAAVLFALAAWARKRAFRIDTVEAEFPAPLYPDETYELGIVEDGAGIQAAFARDGALHLRAKARPTLALREWATTAMPAQGPVDYLCNRRRLGNLNRLFNLRQHQLPLHQLNTLLWVSCFSGTGLPSERVVLHSFRVDFAASDPQWAALTRLRVDIRSLKRRAFAARAQAAGVDAVAINAICL